MSSSQRRRPLNREQAYLANGRSVMPAGTRFGSGTVSEVRVRLQGMQGVVHGEQDCN